MTVKFGNLREGGVGGTWKHFVNVVFCCCMGRPYRHAAESMNIILNII